VTLIAPLVTCIHIRYCIAGEHQGREALGSVNRRNVICLQMHAAAKAVRGPVASSRSLLVCLSPALLCAFMYIFWFRDTLSELTRIGDLPLPQPNPPANKRRWDSEAPMAFLSPPKDDSPLPSDAPSRLQRVTSHVPTPMRHLPLPQETRSAAQEDQSQTQDQLRLLPLPQLSQVHRPLHAHHLSDSLQSPQPSECYRLPMYSNELAILPPHGKFSITGQSLLDYRSHSYWYPPTELGSGSGSTTTNITSSIIGNSDTSSSSSTFSYWYPIVTETKPSTQRDGVIGGGLGSLMNTTDSSAMYNHAAPFNYHPGAPDSDTGSYVAPTRSNRNSYAGSSSPSGGSYAAPAVSSTSHAASTLAGNSMGMYRGQSSGGGMVYAPQGSHLRLVDSDAEQPQTPYIDSDSMSTWSTAPTEFTYVVLFSSQGQILTCTSALCVDQKSGDRIYRILASRPSILRDILSTDRPTIDAVYGSPLLYLTPMYHP
jgi:hypothetical protein